MALTWLIWLLHIDLTVCLLGSCFLLSADFFPKSSFRNTIWPDLGSNCLQRLPADSTNKQRVKGGKRSKLHRFLDSSNNPQENVSLLT